MGKPAEFVLETRRAGGENERSNAGPVIANDNETPAAAEVQREPEAKLPVAAEPARAAGPVAITETRPEVLLDILQPDQVPERDAAPDRGTFSIPMPEANATSSRHEVCRRVSVATKRSEALQLGAQATDFAHG